MIEIDKTEVSGWTAAIRGMRNPMNSWAKSDSITESTRGVVCEYSFPRIGKNDKVLMQHLLASGHASDRKFLRMIHVSTDVNAPLYWWKEYDTYKVGTTANSCSTMHKLMSREFEITDFSCDGFDDNDMEEEISRIELLNRKRALYLDLVKDPEEAAEAKRVWKVVVQKLGTNYMQKRTIDLNYEVLRNIYHSRKNHKLSEWHEFCQWIESLPQAWLIISP